MFRQIFCQKSFGCALEVDSLPRVEKAASLPKSCQQTGCNADKKSYLSIANAHLMT